MVRTSKVFVCRKRNWQRSTLNMVSSPCVLIRDMNVSEVAVELQLSHREWYSLGKPLRFKVSFTFSSWPQSVSFRALYCCCIINGSSAFSNFASSCSLNTRNCYFQNVDEPFEMLYRRKSPYILENCSLKSLPKELGKLTTLKLLSLAHNQIQTMPEEIGNLVQLEKLDCSYNK